AGGARSRGGGGGRCVAGGGPGRGGGRSTPRPRAVLRKQRMGCGGGKAGAKNHPPYFARFLHRPASFHRLAKHVRMWSTMSHSEGLRCWCSARRRIARIRSSSSTTYVASPEP